MALEVVKLYISLLSQFFLFSDMFVSTPPSDGTDSTPAHLPKNSNSLTTAHHLMKILGEIQDTVNDITGLEISKEANSSLKGLLDSARWKFEEIFTRSWLRGTAHDIAYLHVRQSAYARYLDRCTHFLLSRNLDRVDSTPIHNCLPHRHA